MESSEVAQDAFEAYLRSVKSDGVKTSISWDALDPRVQKAWRESVHETCNVLSSESPYVRRGGVLEQK